MKDIAFKSISLLPKTDLFLIGFVCVLYFVQAATYSHVATMMFESALDILLLLS